MTRSVRIATETSAPPRGKQVRGDGSAIWGAAMWVGGGSLGRLLGHNATVV